MSERVIWSLFSGIGGLEAGLEESGLGRVKLQVEVDDFCLNILREHWPRTPRRADVRTVNRETTIGIPDPDILCGGFPCQPVSVAGRNTAQADERWLWPEFERIIGEFRPSWVVIENVPGLRKRGLDVVLRGLSDHGYDAEWIRLSAAAVGAPHLRERLFIVAYPGSQGRQQDSRGALANEGSHAGIASPQDHFADSNAQGNSGADLAAPEPRVFTQSARNRLPFKPEDTVWATEPDVGRVAYGIPDGVDRLKALGNAVVPQCAQFVGECIVEAIKWEE